MLRRRDLPGLFFGGALTALGLGRAARADVPAASRRFLFVFADGGWDPTWVFAPAFDNPFVDMPTDGSTRVDEGGLSWVSHGSRPSVDTFFHTWGARTAILNGLEVRSIAHERCKRLLLTGTASGQDADIPTLIAGGARTHLPLGHVVFSGPAYQSATSSDVVRVGASRQLAQLLDGTCVDGTTPPLRLPASELVSLEDAWVLERATAAAAAAGRGGEARVAEAYRAALADLPSVEQRLPDLSRGAQDSLSQLMSAVDLLGSGATRCAMVADYGYFDGRWDHHSELTRQGPSYETLFGNLLQVVEALAGTPGTWGDTLLDEITVVVFSEMGRFPSLNASGGKDHWMTTSMMLVGGGIRGGQVVGAYGDDFNGVPIVPETGEVDEDGAGVVPGPASVGATLLSLAGLDPAEAFGDVAPLEVLLDR